MQLPLTEIKENVEPTVFCFIFFFFGRWGRGIYLPSCSADNLIALLRSILKKKHPNFLRGLSDGEKKHIIIIIKCSCNWIYTELKTGWSGGFSLHPTHPTLDLHIHSVKGHRKLLEWNCQVWQDRLPWLFACK